MKNIIRCINVLRAQLERHRHSGLKEYPTRAIFIDPLLSALGWDVRDPDEVELEYPTVDGKSVDYAMKVNRKPVFLLEAKQLGDELDDVKSITQVVGYAANDGIEWCVLTNGRRYKIYKATEKASAPDKLLFEVSIDPRDSTGLSVEQIADGLSRLSRDFLAQGALDKLGSEIFTTAKVRKALDRLFTEAPQPIVRLIRKSMGDSSIGPSQIQQALARIWDASKLGTVSPVDEGTGRKQKSQKSRGSSEYSESHHTGGKPSEVIELYRNLDRLCQDLAPGQIGRRYTAKYVSWSLGKVIFCCAHLQQANLRVWVKVSPKTINPADASFARDVSNIGHWGSGDVELAIDSLERLRAGEKYIRQSFDKSTRNQA
jgi:hypothetical protein